MKHENLKIRTKRFALDCIRLSLQLPNSYEYWVVGKQLVRSASAVGANYRSACRAKSRADFIAKLSTVEEEADETQYWLELLDDLWNANSSELRRLRNEAGQLTAIMIRSKKTARANARMETD